MPEPFKLPAAWAVALEGLGQSADLSWEPGELACLVPDPEHAKLIFSAALQVRLAEAQGHTRLSLGASDAPEWLGSFGSAPDIAGLLSNPGLIDFVGNPGGPTPLVAGDGWLATGRSHRLELRLAHSIRALLAPSESIPLSETWRHSPFQLNEEQQRAVQQVGRTRLTLVTGGPGTGKTSILAALLKAFDGLPTALAAPTGKAAQRMGLALGESSSSGPLTLHRLLGFRPRRGEWRHHAGNPLSAQLVIVDEASMIDLEMMVRLSEAMKPEARLVLLGDADQLPSVGRGAVMRDLVKTLPSATIRLEHSYRMDLSDPDGSAILHFAQRVSGGVAMESDVPVRASVHELVGRGIELLPASELPSFLQEWRGNLVGLEGFEDFIFREHVSVSEGVPPDSLGESKTLMAHYDRFRLLALLQEGPRLTGAADLNGAIHAMAWSLNGRGSHREQPFYPGEPVMMIRNDYTRGLFNGDQGLVVTVRRDGGTQREVVFWKGDRPVLFPLAPLASDLVLAYAITVHKAQGSEFEVVALVLPVADHPLLTRQNLYTALTRARRHSLIVGDAALLTSASHREDRRATGLPELLLV